ncbi:MAG: VOC family protein [Planctomycetes bacterium]|nr:VOC family protein [Planctomycetota bacterium]
MDNLTLDDRTRAVVDRMEHCHLGVADADRSIDFYRRAFGFEVRHDAVGPYGRCVHVGSDRFYLALSEDPGLERSRRSDSASFYHLGLTTPDLAAFKARLVREGLQVVDEARRPEGDALYLNDPDGHQIEVVSYKAGYVYA